MQRVAIATSCIGALSSPECLFPKNLWKRRLSNPWRWYFLPKFDFSLLYSLLLNPLESIKAIQMGTWLSTDVLDSLVMSRLLASWQSWLLLQKMSSMPWGHQRTLQGCSCWCRWLPWRPWWSRSWANHPWWCRSWKAGISVLFLFVFFVFLKPAPSIAKMSTKI